MTSIAIVYHSGYGHTAEVAKSVAQGAAEVAATLVHLIPIEEAEAKADLINGADAIIFGSPTYMGSVSGPFKTWMDATAKVWFGQGWKDKIAAGFTVSASQSGDKLNTLIQLAVFAAQHGMIWVGTGLMPGNNSSNGSVEDINRLGSFLGAMAQANSDQGPELAPPQADRKTAALLGQRVAEAAKRWVK
ncbi:MAG: flavodoxin family protein [Alphaproteobacteria bacterium]|nr:flavodoxin family protein [Alphaproteobacteria bacterium]